MQEGWVACANKALQEMQMHVIERVTTTDSCTFTVTVSHCNVM